MRAYRAYRSYPDYLARAMARAGVLFSVRYGEPPPTTTQAEARCECKKALATIRAGRIARKEDHGR